MKDEVARLRQSISATQHSTAKASSFLLVPGRTRGASGGQERLTVPGNVTDVHLELDYPKAVAGAVPGRAQVGEWRPVEQYSRDDTEDYVLHLEALSPHGYDEIESYSFGVNRMQVRP
jgi:hypothetical protein